MENLGVVIFGVRDWFMQKREKIYIKDLCKGFGKLKSVEFIIEEGRGYQNVDQLLIGFY